MKLGMPAFLLVLLSACAYSPQQIMIAPQISALGDRVGAGQSVRVISEDAREDKIIGSRGGMYSSTSTISIKNNLTDAIVQSAEAKLAAQGYSINSGQEGTVMKIIVDDIRYGISENGLKKNIDLTTRLRVELTNGPRSYSGKYQTEMTKESLKSPNAAWNEKMINEQLAKTLERIFVDPKVVDFIAAGDQAAPMAF